ncbi:hypothetical protein PV328_007708 [Microctonus aethiopoides]|uniref:Uncharacterized protein n=1 Tax=Microctonus aethiopoides TaxID=144406 RepID=A0AA39CA50_9HYME|nr:hypothetical protein PV328_007708 [Microctonus aethiopoides]
MGVKGHCALSKLMPNFIRGMAIDRMHSVDGGVLVHLPDCVKNLGPLWAYTCYEYENLNGQLLQLIHGTEHIDTQIANSHNQFMKIPKLIECLPEGQIKEFLLRYLRLLKDKKLYICEKYTRELQSKFSVVKYSNLNRKHFGIIDCFVKLSCNCFSRECQYKTSHIAIVKEIISDGVFIARGNPGITYSTSEFLHKCHTTNNITAVPIEDLITVCVFMKIDDEEYIAIPVNDKELE